ncbi:MAG: tetratricopeptide repeat protein [Candidatus Omnitrophota bacterium]
MESKTLRIKVGLVFAIVLLIFAAYSFVLDSGFRSLDDQASIVENIAIRNFDRIGEIFSSSFFGGNSYYRPLVSLSYMLEYHFFGTQAFFYYLTNVFLHLAVSWVVFLVLQALLEEKTAAFFAAVIWAIHPIQWEAVANISGRSILLCAFFYLSSFLLFVLSRGRKSFPLYFFSLFFFGLALLSKESAFMLPALIGGYQGIINKRKENWPLIFKLTAPFFLVDLIYLAVRFRLGISNIFFARTSAEIALDALTFLRSVFIYVGRIFLPVHLYFDEMEKVFAGFSDPGLLLTALLGIGLFVLAVTMRKQATRLVLFLMLWLLIELWPVSQVAMPIKVQAGYISTANHFLYTPLISLVVLIVLAFRWFYRQNINKKILSLKALRLVVAGWLVFIYVMTLQQNIYAKAEIGMLQRSLTFRPEHVRVRNSLALAYARQGLFKEAERQFRKSLDVEPANVRSRIGLGKALCDQGKCAEGLMEYEKVTDAGGFRELLDNNLELTYRILIKDYQKLIQKEPLNSQAYYSLGVICVKAGGIDEAIRNFAKAVELAPENRNALFNLGSCLESQGDFLSAVRYYEKLVALPVEKDEIDDRAYTSLGHLYIRLGDPEKAEEYFGRSRKIREDRERLQPENL